MNKQIVKHLTISLLAAVFGFAAPVNAATTDLAAAPMASTGSTSIKPNLLFLLDDSGSMAWDRLSPDTMANTNNNTDFCYMNSAFNGVYYNPGQTYDLPVTSTGTNYPNSTFTNAKDDGFDITSPTHSNLSTGFKTGGSSNNSISGPGAFYYTYHSTTATITTITVSGSSSTTVSSIKVNGIQLMSGTSGGSNNSSTVAANIAAKITKNGFSAMNWGGNTVTIIGPASAASYTPVITKSGTMTITPVGPFATTPTTPVAGICYPDANYTRVNVTSVSAEAQNFANWYSYYRTRMLTMKSAVGLAFKDIDNSDRVGFATINSIDNASPLIVNISDFDATQRALWYADFYAIVPNNSTPLRVALANAGRIYAHKLPGAADPMQYSCQQNFTIMTTDGMWNEVTNPKQIDGTTDIGNQDNSAPRPMYDGSGSSNTLADVAYYYYQTDLRDLGLNNCTGALGTDVCFNNVFGAGADNSTQQHMTTFTVGLGVVGTLDSTGYYPTSTSTSTDYNKLVTGPNNWPAPVSDTNTTIDDLWHAAVNGRGQYFSAKDPNALVSGLSSALAGVAARKGASAAASTSNMQPVSGDSYAYVALFNMPSWDGDLKAEQIDPLTGKFVQDPVTRKPLIIWSAQTQLDSLASAASDTRTIYTFDSSVSAAPSKLKPFTWANLNATEQGYFSNMCSSTYLLSQCPTLIADDITNHTTNATAASGANLVNYLRGQYGFDERVTNTSQIYRLRSHVLGDIVNAQPQYVKKPPFDYTDVGYAAFKTAQAALNSGTGRTPMVYSGANDGMLHAFDGVTGTEQWAYIPPMVMNNLYRLASDDYSTNHRYFVDGTPTVADVCPNAPGTCTGAQWKTILVGGLNGGGRGYYALDITDPANPKALWNYTVANQGNLGYTYGNPVVAKRKDNCTTLSGVTTCTGGTWVVAVSSGYNNVSPGDGKGHLFILNAYTGAQLEDIVDTAGDSVTPNPSGLSKINAWVNNPGDNTAERFYGGDLLGNVWRFDIDNNVPPAGKEAFLLAQLGKVDLSTVQPVTIKPELAEIIDSGGNSHAVVQVATGRYLGLSDLPNTDQQSVYSFKDNLTATGLGLVRTPGVLVKQTLTTYTDISTGNLYRKSSNNPVDWSNTSMGKSGWYVDLNPGGNSPGERVNIDMNMQQTTLSVTGNVPDSNACNIGGYAWIYYFNFESGYLAPLAGIKDTANSLIAGMTQIQDATGKTHTIITHTDGTVTVQDDVAPPPVLGTSRRGSWRELTY